MPARSPRREMSVWKLSAVIGPGLGGKHLQMILYHREQSRYLLVFGPLLIYFDDRALSALWESMRLIDRMR